MTKSDARRLKLTRSLAEAHALADAVLERARAARKRTAPKRADRIEKTRATREERRERLHRIRVALLAESGGRCVICGGLVHVSVMHAHHILGGPERRSEERQETMAPTHGKCHDVAHGKGGADPLPALRSLLSWCAVTGRTVAVASLVRRISKIEEARRTPSVPIRITVKETA